MIKCLIYCTKAKPYLYGCYGDNGEIGGGGFGYLTSYCPTEDENAPFRTENLNGKIVAQFDCEKVDTIEVIERKNEKPVYIGNGNVNYHWGFGDTCLSYEQLYDYLKNNNGYAIHISNLEIFDEPKELYEYDIKPKPFKTVEGWSITNITYSCTKAPQNMFNVYDRQGNHYVLISIRPEWVCKILNGEKTIEIRKSIVNKLKELI